MPGPEQADHRSGLSRWLLPEGTETDPRFSLANERTFLAWIRTALAFLASGIGLEALSPDAFSDAVRSTLSGGAIVVAVVISASAVLRWVRVERALRLGRALPVPFVGLLLAVGVVFLGATVLVALLR